MARQRLRRPEVDRRAARCRRGHRSATSCPCWSSGADQPAGRRRRVRRCRRVAGRAGPTGSTSTASIVRAGSAVALPVLARRTAAAALDRVRVGGRRARLDRRRRADERRRARLRHRRLPRPRRDLRPAHAAVVTGGPPTSLGLRFRGSNLADHQVVLTPSSSWPTATSSAPKRDRRHRALAARAPAGRPERRVGVRQPDPRRALRRRADRSARPARLPHRRRVRLRQARQLHPGRRRGDRGGRQGRDRRGARRGRRARPASSCAARSAWSASPSAKPAAEPTCARDESVADEAQAKEPSRPEPTSEPDDVPDVVLEELLAAFSDERRRGDRLRRPVDRPAARARRQRRQHGRQRRRQSIDDLDDEPDATAPARCDRLADIVEHGRARARLADPTSHCRATFAEVGQGHRDRRRRSARRAVPRRGVRVTPARSAHVATTTSRVGGRRSSSRISTRPAASRRCRRGRSGSDRSAGARQTHRRAPGQGPQAVDLGGDRRGDPASCWSVPSPSSPRRCSTCARSTCRAPCTPIPSSCRPSSTTSKGDAILLVDTRQIERQLESIAWVESARVKTQFPHRVFIDIRERKPIATFAGSDGKFRVIDRDGRVLDVLDGGIPIDYMLITGANPDVDQRPVRRPPLRRGGAAGDRPAARDPGTDRVDRRRCHRREPHAASCATTCTVQLGPAASDLSTKLARLLSQVQWRPRRRICRLDVSTAEISRTTTG